MSLKSAIRKAQRKLQLRRAILRLLRLPTSEAIALLRAELRPI